MAKAKRKNKFGGKVAVNTQKQRTQGSSYGHLQLPRGCTIFKETPGGKVNLNFMPYVVTDPNHMDRDIDNGIAIPGNPDTNLWYKKPYRLHRNIGSENKSVVCPSTWGKPCPICEYKATRLKDGAEYDEVRELKPSLRNLYLVVPIGAKDYKEEVCVWDISQFLFQETLNEELEENEEFCAFPDLEEGLLVRVRFSEEKFGTSTFAKTSRIDFEDRDAQYEDSVLEDIPNLDEMLVCPSYAEVEALFFESGAAPQGDTDDEEEEEEEDEAPRKTKKAELTRKKKPAPEPEPEEEEEETDEEEPEEDEAPEPGDEEEDEEEPEEDVRECRACQGTGVNSKGGECKPCRGSGQRQVGKTTESPAPVRKKAAPAPAPKKKALTKNAPEEAPKKLKAKPAEGKGKCPHGFKFGVDTDTKDECDECNLWDDCIEVKERA